MDDLLSALEDKMGILTKQEADLLRERDRLHAELAQRRGWQKCETHQQINADHAWGCPDCVGEMRCKISNLEAEIKLLREFEAGARSDNGEAEMLAAAAKLDEFRRKRGEYGY